MGQIIRETLFIVPKLANQDKLVEAYKELEKNQAKVSFRLLAPCEPFGSCPQPLFLPKTNSGMSMVVSQRS